jgi:hypothetical protein
MEDVIDEADYSIHEDLCNMLVVDPLCKLVDGHQHMGKSSWCCSQRPNHVQTPIDVLPPSPLRDTPEMVSRR